METSETLKFCRYFFSVSTSFFTSFVLFIICGHFVSILTSQCCFLLLLSHFIWGKKIHDAVGNDSKWCYCCVAGPPSIGQNDDDVIPINSGSTHNSNISIETSIRIIIRIIIINNGKWWHSMSWICPLSATDDIWLVKTVWDANIRFHWIKGGERKWTNVVPIKIRCNKIIFVYSFCTKFSLSSFIDTDTSTDNGH